MNVIDTYINPQFMSVPKPVENDTDPLIMNEVHQEIIEEQNPSVTKTKTSCSQKFKEMLNQAKNQMQSLCNSRVSRIAAGSLCVALTAALAIICLINIENLRGRAIFLLQRWQHLMSSLGTIQVIRIILRFV